MTESTRVNLSQNIVNNESKVSQKMKAFSVRLKDQLHEMASQKADELGIPITELVRQALDSFCKTNSVDESKTSQSNPETILRIKLLESQLESSMQQVLTKDKQIEELLKQQDQGQQLAGMQQKTIDKLTEQNQLLLESSQEKEEKKVGFWGRLIGQRA